MQRLFAVPIGVNPDFCAPYRAERCVLQAYTWHSTHAETADSSASVSEWGCAMQNSWERSWRLTINSLIFFFFLISKVACWPPAPPLTEVSNRGQFVNPEVGMLFVYNKHYLMLFQYSIMVLVFGWLHGIGRATLEFSVFIVQPFWTLVYIPVTCNKLFSFIQNLALVGGKRRSLWMNLKVKR